MESKTIELSWDKFVEFWNEYYGDMTITIEGLTVSTVEVDRYYDSTYPDLDILWKINGVLKFIVEIDDFDGHDEIRQKVFDIIQSHFVAGNITIEKHC